MRPAGPPSWPIADPKIDDVPILAALSAGSFYIGALGSRKTHGKRVERLIALRTQHVGPDDIIVNAKVEFDPTLTMVGLAEVVNELEVELRKAEPKTLTIFIEPDVYRSPESSAPAAAT